ncbi:MAG: hypothetical protein J0H69_23785 [Burkholderiales bacterium]|jgi:hypothetical protein|nr:hypothetical protein [Burkholderiales bacterium]
MLEPPRRTAYATWPGTLAVLVFLVTFAGGLQAWDRSVPALRDLEGDQPLVVGLGARFTPAPGWRINLPASRSGNALALYKDGAAFIVSTSVWSGGEQGPMARQMRILERARGLNIDGDPEPYLNGWGLQGQSVRYFGAQLTGRYWQMVDAKAGLVIQVNFQDARSGHASHLAEARAMVDSMDLFLQ